MNDEVDPNKEILSPGVGWIPAGWFEGSTNHSIYGIDETPVDLPTNGCMFRYMIAMTLLRQSTFLAVIRSSTQPTCAITNGENFTLHYLQKNQEIQVLSLNNLNGC
jgi:hypothetical protein